MNFSIYKFICVYIYNGGDVNENRWMRMKIIFLFIPWIYRPHHHSDSCKIRISMYEYNIWLDGYYSDLNIEEFFILYQFCYWRFRSILWWIWNGYEILRCLTNLLWAWTFILISNVGFKKNLKRRCNKLLKLSVKAMTYSSWTVKQWFT